MKSVQFYETTVADPDSQNAFTFLTIPARSLPEGKVPNAKEVARSLLPVADDDERITQIGPVEAWSLPFFVDAALGRRLGPDISFEWNLRVNPPSSRGPSAFAQHVVFDAVVPFESSPLRASSLAQLVGTGGGATAVVSAILTGDPILFIAVPAGIIVCGAAAGVAQALNLGLRAKILERMGYEDRDLKPTEPRKKSKDDE
jgi:hypothetical protein